MLPFGNYMRSICKVDVFSYLNAVISKATELICIINLPKINETIKHKLTLTKLFNTYQDNFYCFSNSFVFFHLLHPSSSTTTCEMTPRQICAKSTFIPLASPSHWQWLWWTRFPQYPFFFCILAINLEQPGYDEYIQYRIYGKLDSQ